MNLIVPVVVPLITGLIGYFVGRCKAFREAKQKAYQEMLPPIIKMAFRSQQADEGQLCEALVKLWLYGSKTVTRKVDHVLYIAHDHRRGNVTKALQEAIIKMRKDIQIWPWQKLKPDEVQHIFTRIRSASGKKEELKGKQDERKSDDRKYG
jgi:hypothetical protein